MDRLGQFLKRACSELGIGVNMEFTFRLRNGEMLSPYAHLPLLGARNGMLVFQRYDHIKPQTDEVTAAGFGFSVLDQPLKSEEFDCNCSGHLTSS